MNRSKLLRVYGFPATSSPAQLVRTSFTGLRGVIGSWQLLLGLGRLYLFSDSLDKNLAKAETEIGAKSKEALLALHGSRLALLGGGVEVLGITLREGFKHASASSFASSVFKTGLSLEAFIGFETHRSDPTKTGKIGGLVNLALDQKIRFSITLPTFDEHRSGYRWYVIVHRHGDGRGYSYRAGEVVASEEFQVPPEYIEHSCTAEFKPSRPQKHIDYKQDKTTIEIIDRAFKLEKGGELRHRHFFGAIELIPDIGAHSIIAATLSIAFWPDRNTPAAYAKMTTLELNE